MNKQNKEKAYFLVNEKKFDSIVDAFEHQEENDKDAKIIFVPTNIKTFLLS